MEKEELYELLGFENLDKNKLVNKYMFFKIMIVVFLIN